MDMHIVVTARILSLLNWRTHSQNIYKVVPFSATKILILLEQTWMLIWVNFRYMEYSPRRSETTHKLLRSLGNQINLQSVSSGFEESHHTDLTDDRSAIVVTLDEASHGEHSPGCSPGPKHWMSHALRLAGLWAKSRHWLGPCTPPVQILCLPLLPETEDTAVKLPRP